MNELAIYSLPLFIVVLGIEKKSLNFPGALSALFLAYIILLTQGIKWFLIMFLFFIIGNLVTRYGWDKKRKLKVLQKIRGSRNVVSNGGIAMLMALLGGPAGTYGFIGAIATATADTTSSELGVLSKETPRMITNFKKVNPGVNGGVTLTGTILGVIASLMIGVSSLIILPSVKAIIIAIVAGLAGNLTDSLVGALLENKKIIGNSSTNLAATTVGAIIGMLVGALL